MERRDGEGMPGAVRRMRNGDAGRIAEIWLETNVRAHSFIPAAYWEAHLEDVREQLPRAEVLVYEDGFGAIQGFVGVNENHIEGIFVHSGVQSRGIGSRLMAAAKAGKSRLTLNVYRKNTRAAEFYRREGFFIQGGQIDGATGEAEDIMVWEKPALQAEEGGSPC